MLTPTPSAEPHGIVLALGGGGAGGLAYIGVLQVLEENNIPVRAIAGTSIGAEIGAFYASGMPVAEITAMATQFDWKQTLGLFLPDLATGGLVSGAKISAFLQQGLGARRIEQLTIGYVAVAADLESGQQVVIDRGDLVAAVRASVALPGIIAPLERDGKRLIDGAVLNPLPLDVARMYFGGPVVAVAVCARQVAPRSPRQWAARWLNRAWHLLERPWISRLPMLRVWLHARLENREAATRHRWTARRVVDRAIDMMQAEIARLHAREHPADCVGICTDCGSAITRNRLDAYPTAKRCTQCQRRYERQRTAGVDMSPSL